MGPGIAPTLDWESMDYSEELAERVRLTLADQESEEGTLLGGKSFWVDDRLVISLQGEDLLIRVPDDIYPSLLEEPGVTTYDFAARPVPGWVLVSGASLTDEETLAEWVRIGLSQA